MDFSGVQAVHLPDSFSFVLQPASDAEPKCRICLICPETDPQALVQLPGLFFLELDRTGC